MRVPQNVLDEIRARLPVSQVVSHRVKLKRAGREYIGLSPFKTERTPSFTVNDQKGFYHCFATGEHGDIFTFLMKAEGLSFMEAVERLAGQAGIALPEAAPADKQREDHLTRVRAALEEACRFFERALASDSGEAARGYLQRRGVEAGEVKEFRLGFAPAGRTVLKDNLVKAGFSKEELVDAGLLIHGEDIPVPYDRFRGRLIFPIRDHKNRVIAFGGRALAPDQQPKYLNSPDTPLFHKGRVLYNLGTARPAVHDAKHLVVAEGYMDVIALSRAGFPHSVAPLGTALTIEQIKLMWTIVPEPALCFDGDAAGQKAAFRAVETAMPHLQPGLSLRFAFLPEGKDPDDLVRSEGSEAVASCIQKAATLIDVLWLREKRQHALDTPEQRAAFDERLRAISASIEHPTVRYHYQSALRERMREEFPFAGRRAQNGQGSARQGERPARNGFADRRTPARVPQSAHLPPTPGRSAPAAGAASSDSPREALILTALINHPWLMDSFADDIATLPFDNSEYERLCNALLEAHTEHEALDKPVLESQLLVKGFGDLLRRLGHIVTHKSDQQFLAGTPEADVVEGWRHITALQRRTVALKSELDDAERAFFDNQTHENFERLRLLKEQDALISHA